MYNLAKVGVNLSYIACLMKPILEAVLCNMEVIYFNFIKISGDASLM